MSGIDVVFCSISTALVIGCGAFGLWVIMEDRKRWAEYIRESNEFDAEMERRSKIDRTIWGAQVPPKDVP